MKVWSIGLFGAAGALLRFAAGAWTNGWWHSAFPLATLLINLLGCFILGWFQAWTAVTPGLPTWFRLGFGTGLVGAFTTFSTFSVETVGLLQNHAWGLASLYVLLSLFGGLACAWAGFSMFRRPSRRKTGRIQPS